MGYYSHQGSWVRSSPHAAKCEFIRLDNSRLAPCPLRSGSSPASIPVTPSPTSAFWVYHWGPEMVSPFVSQKLLSNLAPRLEKLMAFEDTQAASFPSPPSLAFNCHYFQLLHSSGFCV